MKKIISILLVLCLMFVCATPALADGYFAKQVYLQCMSMLGTSGYGHEYELTVTVPLPNGETYTVVKRGVTPADVGFVQHVFSDLGHPIGGNAINSLYSATVKIPKAINGAILFYLVPGKEMRVGIYVNGYQFVIKKGVVARQRYTAKNWTAIGMLKETQGPGK